MLQEVTEARFVPTIWTIFWWVVQAAKNDNMLVSGICSSMTRQSTEKFSTCRSPALRFSDSLTPISTPPCRVFPGLASLSHRKTVKSGTKRALVGTMCQPSFSQTNNIVVK